MVNSRGKEINQYILWKKIILKGNMATKYIEYKCKNTGTINCKAINISKLHCFSSSTKCWKTVSLKHFGLSVEIWSQFSRLVCFDWVCN